MRIRNYGEKRPHARPHPRRVYMYIVRSQYEYGIYKVTQSSVVVDKIGLQRYTLSRNQRIVQRTNDCKHTIQ